MARARAVLTGERITPEEALPLVKRLRTEMAYKHAREISHRFHRDPAVPAGQRFEFLRVLVTSTYKDLALPPEESLPRSLAVLRDAGYDLERLKGPEDGPHVPEVLALAGAIHKRLWEHDGDVRHLERSLRFYTAGYGSDETTDNGYQAVNAAYLLDLLASLDATEGGLSPARDDPRAQRARRIRETLAARLPALQDAPGGAWLRGEWWYHATLAEVFVGVGDAESARDWLRKGLRIGTPAAEDPEVRAHARPDDWELESTTHQLASLARIQSRLDGVAFTEDSPTWTCVREAFGGTMVAGVHSAFVGKIGLALSGGGFRASLYHIGVLARLAELDVLRHVEVLSCVSGGSILGARYYLEVRRLLQTKPDQEIRREDYVTIVETIAEDFVRGVQTNLRNRLFSEPWTAVQDAFSRRSVRTERLGELMEEELYGRVDDGEGGRPRWLNRLHIEPARHADDGPGEALPFNPRLQNWRRRAKVPILVLNATTLNTGHTWQFTSSWMGEPPGGSDPRVDSTDRLRRVRYSDAPPAYRQVRLGHAVAASACVPGLFAPLVLPGLYPGTTVRLVDGGVHDNQGTATLLEQGCTVLLVSDASGQLDLASEPPGDGLGVPVRANNILMARVREAQFHLLEDRRKSMRLRGLLYVHLKSGLESGMVDPLDTPEPARIWTFDQPAESQGRLLTPYGMRRDVQACLARLRTDLDAFSDLEAYALMESGYRVTRQSFAEAVPTFAPPAGAREEAWTFHRVAPRVAGSGTGDTFAAACAHLGEGCELFWKGRPVVAGIRKVYGATLGRPGVGKKRMATRVVSAASAVLALPMRVLHGAGTRAWLRRGVVG